MSTFLRGIGVVLALAGCAVPDAQSLLPDAPRPLFVARNDYLVYAATEPGRFEIVGRPGASGADYFCAAGDFAFSRVNARAADRVVVVSPVGPSQARPGSRSVVFTILPRGEAPRRQSITANVARPGENLRVAHAQTLCGGSLDVNFFN